MRTLTTALICLALAVPAVAQDDLDGRRQAIQDRLTAIETNAEGLSEAERLDAFIQLYFDYSMLE